MNMFPIYPVWMRDELGLSGTKLLLYANIYHNTRNGPQTFNLPILAWWCGVSSRSIERPISELVAQGLLMKQNAKENTATLRTLRPGVLFSSAPQNQPQEQPQEQPQNQPQEQPQIMKDKERSKEKEIKENNNIACVKEKIASAQGEILNGKDKFVAPEWNEVWAYALTRGATAEEAQKFYAYYSMNGWKNRGVPLENWKAALGYWLLNNRESRGNYGTGASPGGGSPQTRNNGAPGGSPAGYHGTGASPAGGSPAPVSKEEQFRAAKMSLQAERDAEFIRRKHEREAAEAAAYQARQAERAAMQHDDALRAAQQAFFANHSV